MNFLISSDRLPALEEDFARAAAVIRKAIIENRPVILRHHADCDGYCAAISLENSILPLVGEAHRLSTRRTYYRRIPMRTPFYSYEDAIKDICFIDSEKSWIKPPLVILADLSPSDDFIVEHLKLHSLNIVVIDHHEVPINSGALDASINPLNRGMDGSLTAGMLAFELAIQLNSEASRNFLLPAISGIADKSDCNELQNYIKLSGESAEQLGQEARCLDFLAYNTWQVDARAILERFFTDREYRARLLKILIPEIDARIREAISAELPRLSEEIFNKGTNHEFCLAILKGGLSQEYPPAGRIAGLLFEELKKKHSRAVLFLVLEDSLIIRSNIPEFNLNEMISELKNELKVIEGGGHPSAGTLRFAPHLSEQIIARCRQFLQEALR